MCDNTRSWDNGAQVHPPAGAKYSKITMIPSNELTIEKTVEYILS